MTNLLLSFGSLFFALLLTIVYFLKSKQTNVDNKIYKLLLIFLDLTIISEILSILVMYYLSNEEILIQVLTRINIILTISWSVNIAFYIILLQNEQYKINYKECIKNNSILKILFLIYVFSIVLSIFIKLDNFYSVKGVYISGYPLYLLYIVGIITILFGIISLINGNKTLTKNKIISIVSGITISIIVMGLQRLFPMYMMLTCMFVFDAYIIYFVFENPDLHLITALEKAKKKAEDSDSAKSEFLSNISYEIKKPVNSILNFSNEILNVENFDYNFAKNNIAYIYSAGNNLLEIINNILDTSKIKVEEEKIENVEYDFGNLILELKNIIKTRLEPKKVQFITEIDPNIPRKLLGDRAKLFRILLNLLSNSVKYTEVGEIKLSIVSKKIDKEKIMLQFQILDTGYGIKKEDYDKLFKKFSRLETATENEIEGTGLGLVIVERLISILGGKVWFESEYGAGTTFYVEVIQKTLDNEEIGENILENKNDEQTQYLDCSNYKVLIVDDNKLNLRVAEKLLSNYRFQITTIDNWKECINSIKKGDEYDLIFLEPMMPDIGDIEVVKKTKKLEGYNIPPIVALTANIITSMKETYLQVGFDDYISKPINMTEMDNLIRRYFKNN